MDLRPVRRLLRKISDHFAGSDTGKQTHSLKMRTRSQIGPHGVLVGPDRKRVMNAIDGPRIGRKVAGCTAGLHHRFHRMRPEGRDVLDPPDLQASDGDIDILWHRAGLSWSGRGTPPADAGERIWGAKRRREGQSGCAESGRTHLHLQTYVRGANFRQEESERHSLC